MFDPLCASYTMCKQTFLVHECKRKNWKNLSYVLVFKFAKIEMQVSLPYVQGKKVNVSYLKQNCNKNAQTTDISKGSLSDTR
jgi:hypothetical protein